MNKNIEKICKNDKLFLPYDRYGFEIDGLVWHNLSYNSTTNHGTFILKFERDAKSIPHIHDGYEEFMVLDGSLNDSSGEIYNKGDFIIKTPGSHHFSYSVTGCTLLVFMRGLNRIV